MGTLGGLRSDFEKTLKRTWGDCELNSVGLWGIFVKASNGPRQNFSVESVKESRIGGAAQLELKPVFFAYDNLFAFPCMIPLLAFSFGTMILLVLRFYYYSGTFPVSIAVSMLFMERDITSGEKNFWRRYGFWTVPKKSEGNAFESCTIDG